ncbi:MAG: tetratricopeptide repeat protein [Myxococcota bacterium]
MPTTYAFGVHRMDTQSNNLTIAGEPVRLQPLVWTLLLTFVQRPRTLLTKNELARLLWPDQVVVSNESIIKVIGRLRKHLRQPFIVTVRGRGYRFDADIRVDTATALEAPPNLPTEVTPLVGRASLLEELDARLTRGHRLLTLCGPGGIGKTRIAVRVVHQQREGGHDVLFIDGRAIHTATRLERAVSMALEPSEVLRQGQVGNALGMRGRLLLVLDNLEQIADVAELVHAWLQQAPELRILTTSRRALGVHGEWVGMVPPLDRDAGHELLRSCATVRLSSEAATALVRRLHGVPLALELAAAALQQTPAGELLARLEDSLQFLKAPGRVSDDRHRSLMHMLRWSWDHLDEAARRACTMLTVLEGSFDLESAEAVLAPTLGRNDVQRLVENSLLRFAPDTGRYGFVLAVREFARARLSPEDLSSIGERHARWFADRWEAARDASTELALDDLDDFLAAAKRSLDPDVRVLCAMGGASLLSGWTPPDDILAIVPPLTLLPQMTVDRQVDLLSLVVSLTLQTGRLEDAEAALNRFFSVVRETHHEWGLIVARRARAELYAQHGNLDAEVATLEALLAEELPREQRARALNNLACAYHDLGRFEKAEAAFRDTIAIRESDSKQAVKPRANLASLYLNQGRLIEAIELAESTLSTCQEHGILRSKASVLRTMAVAIALQGDAQTAVTYFTESLKIRRRLGPLSNIANNLVEFGPVLASLARYIEADDCLREATTLFEQAHRPDDTSLAMALRAELHLALDNLSTVHELTQKGLERATAPRAQSEVLRVRGRFHQARGHLDVAEGEMRDAVRAAELADEPLVLVHNQVRLASICLDVGRHDEAIDLLHFAHDRAVKRGARTLEALTLVVRSKAATSSAESSDWLVRADRMRVAMGLPAASPLAREIKACRR